MMNFKQSRFLIDHGRGSAAVALLIVLPVVQVGAPRIAPGFLLAALDLIFTTHVLTMGRYWQKFDPLSVRDFIGKNRNSTALSFGLIVWGLISLLWSDLPYEGLRDIIFVLFLVFFAFFAIWEFRLIPHVRFPIVYLVGMFVGSWSLVFSIMNADIMNAVFNTEYKIFDLNRCAVALAIMLNCTYFLGELSARWKAWCVVIWLSVFVAVFLSDSETAKLGMIISAGTYIAVRIIPDIRYLVFASICIFILIMPVFVNQLGGLISLLPDQIDAAAHLEHRIVIWEGYSQLISNSPIWGFGMKSDHALGVGQFMQSHLSAAGFLGGASSPHNAALEIWVNLGFVGIAIIIGLILVFIIETREKNDLYIQKEAGTTASIACIFSISMSGSSLFQAWFLTTIVIFYITVKVLRIQSLDRKRQLSA